MGGSGAGTENKKEVFVRDKELKTTWMAKQVHTPVYKRRTVVWTKARSMPLSCVSGDRHSEASVTETRVCLHRRLFQHESHLFWPQ